MAKRKDRRDTAAGFQPTANPELARAMQELRRSNAAQRHVPAPRKGTRRQREQQAIHDQRQDTKD